jgi:hypothetical protein
LQQSALLLCTLLQWSVVEHALLLNNDGPAALQQCDSSCCCCCCWLVWQSAVDGGVGESSRIILVPFCSQELCSTK